MSKYSETIGSFLRTGNYPLEADYIFNSELELKDFYADSEILHEGLLKVVKTEDTLSLYWVYDNSGTLEFRKLIDFDSTETLFQEIEKLKADLEAEIELREESDESLETEIAVLDSILAEAEANIRQHKRELQAIVGTDEDNLVEYLKTLDFQNLTVISNTLNKFLNTIDGIDEKINTLPELQKFLSGYSDTQTLSEILNSLTKEIVGNPNKLNTLESLESALLTLTLLTKNREDNLQTELDLTQVGVGLSGDGSYNADKETYYLQDATSVMNALKTLDRVIHNVTGAGALLDDAYYDPKIEALVLLFKLPDETVLRVEIPADKLITEWEPENNDSAITLTRERVIDGSDKVYAEINISQDENNALVKKEDGLYVKIELEESDWYFEEQN